MGPKLKLKKPAEGSPLDGGMLCIRKTVADAPNFNTPMILVTVGHESNHFRVHQDLVTSSSGFFKAALNGPWLESSGIVRLPESDPALFNLYIQYLYTGKIYSQAPEDKKPGGEDAEWDRLINLYILGDVLCDPTFGNAIIDAMIEKWRLGQKWPMGYATVVYTHTCAGAALRRLIVDFHVYLGMGRAAGAGGSEGEAPKEFFQDVVVELTHAGAALYEKIRTEPWDIDQCRYHEHDSARCGD